MHGLILSGLASWYSLPGNLMANGHPFRNAAHVCAMRFARLGRLARIFNLSNGRQSWCKISDRGPFVFGRIIDVSPRVRDELRLGGLAPVRVYLLPQR